MKAKPRISKITVSRLFNLGNYENCSYSLTVDVPEGASATRAVIAVEKILHAMKPNRNLLNQHSIDTKIQAIAEMKKLSPENFQRRHGEPAGGRKAYTKRCEASLKEELAAHLKAAAEATRARRAFDDLGGTERWKDAKLDWEDTDCDY